MGQAQVGAAGSYRSWKLVGCGTCRSMCCCSGLVRRGQTVENAQDLSFQNNKSIVRDREGNGGRRVWNTRTVKPS